MNGLAAQQSRRLPATTPWPLDLRSGCNFSADLYAWPMAGRPQFERLFDLFRRRYDPEGRVSLVKASETPGLAEYLSYQNAVGSAVIGNDNQIEVRINDTIPVDKVTILEELYHVLQYVQKGAIPLSCDHADEYQNELEVAECLLSRSRQLRLSDLDVARYELARQRYGGTP